MSIIDLLRNFLVNQTKLDFEWGKECQKVCEKISEIKDFELLKEAVKFDFENDLLLPIEIMFLIFEKWLEVDNYSDESVAEYVKYLSYFSPDYDCRIEELLKGGGNASICAF